MPEVVAVGARGVEIQVAAVRVQEHVVAEVVVVPLEAAGEIPLHGLQGDVRVVSLAHIAVEGPQPHVESGHGTGGSPEMLLLQALGVCRVWRCLDADVKLYRHLGGHAGGCGGRHDGDEAYNQIYVGLGCHGCCVSA